MKTMKKMKKVLAMILSLAMVLGMSVTAFASDESDPATPEIGSETNVARINGVFVENPMPTVEAYRIITYNENGYYEVVPALKDWITTEQGASGTKPVIKLSSTNAQDLYYNHLDVVKQGDKAEFVAVQSGETYTGEYTKDDLGLGTWLVVVTSPSGKYLYNPAVISVSQTADGVNYGTLNLTTDSWLGETGVYLKRDEPTITKTAEPAENDNRSVESQEKDTSVVGTQFNDIIKYTITADIPAYTEDRENITYKITDTIKGLDYLVDTDHPVIAAIEGASEEDVATIQKKAEEAMKAPTTVSEATDSVPAVKRVIIENLGDEWIKRNSNKQIVITYYAKVTSTVKINVDRLDNTAELDYSNNNTTEDSSKTGHKDDKTKHYTFGIDAAVMGADGNQSQTGEFIKINEKGDVEYKEKLGEVNFKDECEPLEGAVFELRVGSSDGPKFTDKSGKDSFTTKENGRIEITGLDDGVDYYLVETKAPEGYTLNTTAIKVNIEATYTEDSETGKKDVLESYRVLIGESEGNTAKVTNYNYNLEKGETTLINTADTPSNPYGFRNTKLSELPSTGGIGTTIFTIGGCIIMIAAAALFFASRRKKAEN